ncbi:MAG: hypothetical protein RR959_08680 [Erysipelotrichaceae bacterium]
MKYKVGDKVKIVSLQGSGRRGDCEDVVGDIGKITRRDSSDQLAYKVKIEGGGKWWWEESNLELIEGIKPNTSEVIETTKGETEMNEVKVKTTEPKFKKGDIVVRTGFSYEDGRMVRGNHYTVNDCIGSSVYLEDVYDDGELDWFGVDHFDLVKSYEEKRNYRNMKPTDLIKVSIDGFEDKIQLGDLVNTKALLGGANITLDGNLFYLLESIFDKEKNLSCIYKIASTREFQEQVFEKYFKDNAEEKANLKELISNKQNELKELQDKLNQLEN